MSVNTFWIITLIIAILLAVVVAIITYYISRDIRKTFIGILIIVILSVIWSVLSLSYNYSIPIRYEGGTRIDGIWSAHYIESTKKYNVKTFNNITYIADDAVRATDTYLLLDCKVYETNLLGYEIVSTQDIVFLNIEEQEENNGNSK